MKTISEVLTLGSKPAILLAEDDPDQSDALREVLESEGYAVETVFSGDVALRRLSSNSFTAAIMDARMPGLHGGTVLKVCRVRDPQICTPIIMVSAFASPRDLDQYKKDGAVASFTKPLEMSEILKCVRQLVDKPGDNSEKPKCGCGKGGCDQNGVAFCAHENMVKV